MMRQTYVYFALQFALTAAAGGWAGYEFARGGLSKDFAICAVFAALCVAFDVRFVGRQLAEAEKREKQARRELYDYLRTGKR